MNITHDTRVRAGLVLMMLSGGLSALVMAHRDPKLPLTPWEAHAVGIAMAAFIIGQFLLD